MDERPPKIVWKVLPSTSTTWLTITSSTTPEAHIASTFRLTPIQYIKCKNTLVLAARAHVRPFASLMPRSCVVSMSTRHPGSGVSLADSAGSARVGTRPKQLRFGAGHRGGVCYAHQRLFLFYISFFALFPFFASR